MSICVACSTGQVLPRPSPKDLKQLYSSDYYAEYGEGAGMAGGESELPAYLKDRLAKLERQRGRGSLLDLGCGIGLLVAYARNRGWKAVGLETSVWAAAEGRRRFGIDVIEQPLETADVEPRSIDVIHANHVLEHLVDPVETLAAAFRALRPGGVLVAEVPQELHEPMAAKVAKLVHPGMKAPPNYHLVFFSDMGLRVAAERAGFAVEQVSNTVHHDGLAKRSALPSIARSIVLMVDRLAGTQPVYEIVARRPEDPKPGPESH